MSSDFSGEEIRLSKPLAILLAVILSGGSGFTGFIVKTEQQLNRADVAEMISSKLDTKIENILTKTTSINIKSQIIAVEVENLNRRVGNLEDYHRQRD